MKKIIGIMLIVTLILAGTGVNAVTATEVDAEPDTRPLAYQELDVEEVRKLGYEGHKAVNCAYGGFYALISPLQEKIGSPYTEIPTYMLAFGGGGIRGEESICGALLGTISAINLITGEDFGPLVDELIEYYKTEPLPTETSNQYAAEGIFYTEPDIDEPLAQSVAGSINCDVSKEQWLEVAEYPEYRGERCHRVTADVAAKAAEILNEWYAQKDEVVDITAKFAYIFPDSSFEKIEENTYEVFKDGELIGYLGLGTEEGSPAAGSNPITIAVGIDLDGVIQGVEVIEHSETEAYAGEFTEEEWLSQFEGLSDPGNVLLTDDTGEIDVITGATETSEAAVFIVQNVFGKLIDFID